MKTIEERAKEWAYRYPMTPDGYLTESDMRAVAINSYIQGTTEQKAIDEQVRLKKCDDMTEAEYNHETAFVDWYLENGRGTPTYSDAIEWSRKEVIDKACEYLDIYFMEIGYPDDWLRDSPNIEGGRKLFRKAMEE